MPLDRWANRIATGEHLCIITSCLPRGRSVLASLTDIKIQPTSVLAFLTRDDYLVRLAEANVPWRKPGVGSVAHNDRRSRRYNNFAGGVVRDALYLRWLPINARRTSGRTQETFAAARCRRCSHCVRAGMGHVLSNRVRLSPLDLYQPSPRRNIVLFAWSPRCTVYLSWGDLPMDLLVLEGILQRPRPMDAAADTVPPIQSGWRPGRHILKRPDAIP